MSVPVWLDVVLVALGLLALSPRLWLAFRHRRTVCPPPMPFGIRTASVLLFYLGLGILTLAGVDFGFAAWDKAHRPNRGDWDAALAEWIEAHRSNGPIDSEATPLEEAPDFCLPSLDEDRLVRLSDFRGRKPVVLIFGSFG